MLLGDRAFGAMMTRPGDIPPMWNFYFRVPATGSATKHVRNDGDVILHGPAEIPGGDHIVIGTDPQGAVFALVVRPG